jgi:hypothetical protein
MTRLIFGAVLVATVGVPFIAMSSNEASAQQRATCSQARLLAARSESAKGGTTLALKLVAGR